MSKKAKIITVGKGKNEQRFNADHLRTISEELFLRQNISSNDPNRLRKVWKQANGFTVPNYENDDNKTEAKPKVKEAKSKEKEASVK